MKKIYLYPLWLRFWHWLNALLFFVLILSGISLHFSASGSLLVPFETAIVAHNICGILVSAIFLFYTIFNIVTGNYKYYIPHLKGLIGRMIKQGKYYLMGIFLREPHPFHSDKKQKFNPMQQIAYFFIIFFGMPLIIISGWMLMFPEVAPNEIFGMGGVWPMAILHTIVGFFLSVFMVAHIYLGTTGQTVGDLFKSMITGWHLSEEVHDEPAPEPAVLKEKKQRRAFTKGILYNSVSMTGALIALLSFMAIAFMIVIEFFSDSANPYSGIVAFIIFPTFLLFGILLMIVGIIRENRRALSLKVRKLPVVDLNNPKHQIATIIISVASVFFIVFSVYGSFKAYEYTDSNDFCGKVCHEVMEPEYSTYLISPHSRVACVKCHIGGNSNWLDKSKYSGLYQVYSVMFDKYSKPITTPIRHLRPSEETCEQCHWPVHFYTEKNIRYNFYLSDSSNTETKLSMLLKIGGGNTDLGIHDGIHWHMNIANEIEYLATDREREHIPWVKVKSLNTGEETIYKSIDTIISDYDVKPEKLRKFDCMDCHNRPSHIFKQPHKVLNSLLANNKIDKSLPYIKRLGVQALENYVTSRKSSFNDIKNFIWGYYNDNYPDVSIAKKNEINVAIVEINNIYQRYYFPSMNVSWKTYPDNIGHLYSRGCFRCHDGRHVNDEGKVIPKDCNVCHTISYQKAPGIENETIDGHIKFIHPGGIDKMVETRICSDCHGTNFPGSVEK